MANHGLTRYIFKLLTKHEIISIGTKYYPTTPLEIEYVEMFNFTQTMLMELEKAEITTDSIFFITYYVMLGKKIFLKTIIFMS